MSTSELHPRGLFGVIEGIEVPFLSHGGRGASGVRGEYLLADSEIVSRSFPGMEGTDPPPAGTTRVPLTAVADAANWTWTAEFEGSHVDVADQRDGELLIWTPDSRIAWSGEWSGSQHDGWYRWITTEGVEVTAHRHPLRASGQES